MSPLSIIYIPICTKLALANLSMEARSNSFFEKMDVKKDEKVSHWEIKLLSPNHKEKQIPTGGPGARFKGSFWMHSDFTDY